MNGSTGLVSGAWGLKAAPGRRVGLIGTAVALGGGVVSFGIFTAAAPPAGASGTCAGTSAVTCTFNYTGSVDSFTVPSGVTQVTIDAKGAQGAGAKKAPLGATAPRCRAPCR